MIKVRKNVFETNSSSTHSIAIPKDMKNTYPTYISFHIGEFGWGFYEENPADYLYTAILTFWDKDEAEEKLNALKKVLDDKGIRYEMQEPVWDKWIDLNKVERFSLENGYIDHAEDLGEFIEAVFADEDTLLNFIFYGYVFTGNDNDDSDGFLCPYEETYKDDEYSREKGWTSKIVKNEYYKPEFKNYNWYMKGN